MNPVRRHPYFTAWIVLCSLLAGVMGWGWQRERAVTQREVRLAKQRAAERDNLQVRIGAGEPVAGVLPGIIATETLSETKPLVVPETSLAAMIALVQAQEQMRQVLRKAGVSVGSDERFGFAAYAREGPAPEETTQVFARLALVRRVVPLLAGSGASKLLSIRSEATAVPGGNARKEGADAFAVEARSDLRQPGLLAGSAIRVTFAGRTEALRRFLGAVEQEAAWDVVCRVTVSPLVDDSKTAETLRVFSVDLVEACPVWPGSKDVLPPAMGVGWMADSKRSGALFDALGGNRARVTQAQPISGETVPAAGEAGRFHAQLAGIYAGADGGRVVLLMTETGELRTLRPGERLADLEVTLREVVSRRVTLPVADDGPPNQVAAEVAILWDERRSALVTLHPFDPTPARATP